MCVVYVAIYNADITLDLQLLGIRDTAQFGMRDISRSINLSTYSLVVLLVGIFSGISWVGQFYLMQRDKLNVYKRELEKSSITNMSSTSKVEVLEAKIATLEKALEDAINNNG